MLSLTEFKEVKNNETLPLSKVAILFTDIKGSSELWSNNEDKMLDSITILENIIHGIIKNNNGMVVKTIGDSFMCSYENEAALLDAIKSAVDIHNNLKDNPIKVADKEIKLRIGICYGEVYIRETEIQNTILKDYFGNTVNTASRMESKVSDVDGFAFSFLIDIDKKEEKEIMDFLKNNNVKIKVLDYNNKCDKKDNTRKRSARLLTDLQINSCKDPDELKGVNMVRVYKCDFK